MRRLGKREAIVDQRVPRMATRWNARLLPAPPANVNWYADLPDTGVPMLGNDLHSCCVEASAFHYLQVVSRYIDSENPLNGTTEECLKVYADVTGFRADEPATDIGTYFMGPTGFVEHWITNGIVIDGKLNKSSTFAQLNVQNQGEIQQAVHLFGFVFAGAQLSQPDMASDFMWTDTAAPSIGGHEFLIAGYETVAGRVYYDIITWNGRWRATEDWLDHRLDEAAVVINPAFFDKSGVDAAGVEMDQLRLDIAAFTK